MNHRFDVVFSGDFLLRDAVEGEPATAGGKRWTEAFHGRSIGHNSHGWPIFAVTSHTAEQLAAWSARHRDLWFRQCRTWMPDDASARREAESHTALYEWNGCYLTSTWCSHTTGTGHHGRAIQLHHGLHLVDGHSWMAVDAELVDIVHGTPAEVQPLRLTLTSADLHTLTGPGSGQLTLATPDGTPITVHLDPP